jgi:Flp pilus assembly pilin Flp
MMRSLRNFVKRLHQDTAGAMSVEKILIIGLIALPILIILLLFKTKIIGWFQGQEKTLTDDSGVGG